MTNQAQNTHETKSARVLAALMSGRSFNRFEAERQLSDHCLHSTVAQLQRVKRLRIERKYETVSGYQGHPTSVCRYWITPEERQRIMNRRSLYLPNKKTSDPTDQDKERGLNLNSIDDTASQNISQTELKNGA